ncbi:hypothetical protein [Xylophilus sp. Leaf220]|uniref:SMODS domain-containing nucleotidyltransferase n=1 Tax=Xylophilus sp. Leaf220 TaxID=1735686 RepID=UPI0006F6F154|nr:hypothetical protein [Xylophilus sp. Leaf220]KQM79643.1 hypothetical protein ASE76_00015 [Xylophilus sp. Leaf220]
MELNQQFKTFLTEIRPTQSQKEGWIVGATTLRTRLNADPDLTKITVSTFLQGSIRRSTAIRPIGDKRPDVDVVVVTTIDYNTTTPEQAMDKFVPFLERHYAGKWRRQGRSFGIELSYVDIDLVITALPSEVTSDQAVTALYKSESVQNIQTLEEQPTWRLNKSWTAAKGDGLYPVMAIAQDAPEQDWKPHPLMLPDRDAGRWGRTHPLAQIQWTAAKNRDCNGHYVNLVKALKCWRQTNARMLPKYPKGYPLEHMIGQALANGTGSMGTGVVQVLEEMRDRWTPEVAMGRVPVLDDHGVPEHNVLQRLSFEDFEAFHKAISDAAAQARKALDAGDPSESGMLWQGLFGAKFPLPSPQGGDRPPGFTKPSGPADPQLTPRFA